MQEIDELKQRQIKERHDFEQALLNRKQEQARQSQRYEQEEFAIQRQQEEKELIQKVEEVFEEKDEENDKTLAMVYGEFQNFGSLQNALEDLKLEIIESGFERIPTVSKSLNEEQTADILPPQR